VFEYVCDVGCFFAYVCEGGPFLFRILGGFFWVSVWVLCF
jgi:hypothetical protein